MQYPFASGLKAGDPRLGEELKKARPPNIFDATKVLVGS
jgi:hypothetical protein